MGKITEYMDKHEGPLTLLYIVVCFLFISVMMNVEFKKSAEFQFKFRQKYEKRIEKLEKMIDLYDLRLRYFENLWGGRLDK